MNDEKIIRDEAKEFLDYLSGGTPIEQFKEIRNRSRDFYTDESKAIFYDEILTTVESQLQTHRDRAHNGGRIEACPAEIDYEKLMFYIQQELKTLPLIVRLKNEDSANKERNGVFVSYSHVDKEFLNDLKRHFKPFLENVNFWDDSSITPGDEWKSEIETALKRAKVGILLVSADFLGSKFISTSEIPPLLEAVENEWAKVLIIILKPCLFEEFPTLNKFQALNSPSNPVIKMDEVAKEELWTNLVRPTNQILKTKKTKR